MCDFHSCVIRADGALAHVAGNSHSSAVAKAGWAENRAHARPCFVEAEWDGIGEYPGAEKICRIPEGEKLTAKQRETVDRHYKALADVMNSPQPSARSLARFAAPEFSDVQIARLRKLPNMPETIGYLAKRIAESGHVDGFAPDFLAAYAAGKDYSMIWPRFSLWLLTDEKSGVIRLAKAKRTRDAINGVAALYARWIETGKKPDVEEWRKVRAATARAATARAAAYAAAAAAAYAAAYAAAAAAAYAAAAYAAYAYADARKLHWQKMAAKLISLLNS